MIGAGRSSSTRPLLAEAWALAVTVLIALGLRAYALGRLSFWYDEVVTMRLARAGGPGALLERLFQIDATRAPLHPLLLSLWIMLFGSSEAAARSQSVACGIATIVLIHQIARTMFDTSSGLWSAWLAALSPVLVIYDREARMYAWLVMLTCLCWWLLLSLRRGWTPAKAVFYAISLTALGYSHPLGVLMLATLALAGLFPGARDSITGKRWLMVYGATAVLILPWIPNYLDHPPESLSGRLPLKFLLGTPIGFVGGNSWILLGLGLMITFGIARSSLVVDAAGLKYVDRKRLTGPTLLLLWLILPPVVLYVYSWVSHPIFGPARYTVFVAPAFLILVALGLSRLPAVVRYPLAAMLALSSAAALRTAAYDPNLKADWRGFARDLAQAMAAAPAESSVVIVASADPGRNAEVETARYYLPIGAVALGALEPPALSAAGLAAGRVYYAIGWKPGSPPGSPPDVFGKYRFREHRRYPGLIVYRGFP
jgi:uncharacterized membrane protein